MAIPFYEDLVYYATPPNSFIGATIFLSYIVFALYATCSIAYSLYTQYTAIYCPQKPNKDARLDAAKTARARHIKIYAFLASISFATLSYHMLFFLITHYLDFARELVQSKGNAVVTQLAILGTWYWNIWMAGKGKHIHDDSKPETIANMEQRERDILMHR
jgi:hypothetical protein